MQTTRTQRRGPLPVGLTSMDSMGLDSQGVFSLPSGLSFWLQPVKFCFPITGWLFHLKTESSANLLGHIIFRVLATALYLTPRLLGQWSIDRCSQYPKARLRRIYQLWGRSFCVMHSASSCTCYWDSRQRGSWDFSPGGRIRGRTGDLRDRGSGCSVCTSQAGGFLGTGLLLPALAAPVYLKASLQHTVSLLPSPEGDWVCRGRQMCLTWEFSSEHVVRRAPCCSFHNLSLWNWTLSKALNISVQFSSVQPLSRVRLFVTPWTAARQASLSITNSVSLGLWNGASAASLHL